MEEYSLNELLLMRKGRGFKIEEIRKNFTAYKNEKDADRKTFFRYLEHWELKDIFDEYYREKNKKLSISWLVFIEQIFSINDTGFRPVLGIVISDKTGNIVSSGEIKQSNQDIKNTIRKRLEEIDLNNKELQETYNYLFLTLSTLFSKDSKEIKEKYNAKIKNNKIALELENLITYEPVVSKITRISKTIIESKRIPQDSKFLLLENFFSDCGKMLDTWEAVIGENF